MTEDPRMTTPAADNSPMQIVVYCSNFLGNMANCLYPHTVVAETEEQFRKAVSVDHVFIRFRDGYRNQRNFEETSVLGGDIDNDHSDDSRDWVTPEYLAARLPDVPYVMYSSRSHMKQKKDQSPRPHYHVVFPVAPIKDPELYKRRLKQLAELIPELDHNAMDAARFFFGNPNAEVIFHPGSMPIDSYMDKYAIEIYLKSERAFAAYEVSIPEGSRNKTMHDIGVRLIKRYGDSNEAYNAFMEQADRCTPALDDDELETIWRSCQRFYEEKIKTNQDYVPPEIYNETAESDWESDWEKPIPMDTFQLPAFPVYSLPSALREYVKAVAESTSTPVDLAATTALACVAVCAQGKYVVQPNKDWREPVNLFILNVMRPSERKSPVLNVMTRPISDYERKTNAENAARIALNKSKKRALEQRQRNLEDQVAKGKAEESALAEIANRLSSFEELRNLHILSDNVTPEKLSSIMAENRGRAAIVSAEAGIFEMMKGMYSKYSNLDVYLKGFSGDRIRVERMGREGELIPHAILSILLMAQPAVLTGLMQNSAFQGRGLTARFLYSVPTSRIGNRPFDTPAIPADAEQAYVECLIDILEEPELPEPETIELSKEAHDLIAQFHDELEKKLNSRYTEITEWVGKLEGKILRVAGLLCRASVRRRLGISSDFMVENPFSGLLEPESTRDPMVIDGDTMLCAIKIGYYFLDHAEAAFSMMGADPVTNDAKKVLDVIMRDRIASFRLRDMLRLCRSIGSKEQMEPALYRLVDYGYLRIRNNDVYTGKGRPRSPEWLVNPMLFEENTT